MTQGDEGLKKIRELRKVEREITLEDVRPDWTRTCFVCSATPIVPLTGMCGPCTFGEASTAGGNW